MKYEDVDKYKRVGGWLSLLCFALIVGNPLRTIYTLVSSYIKTNQYFDIYPGLEYLFYIDSLLSLFLMAFSIRAGLALLMIKPGAVKTAKNYLFLFLGYSVIAIFLPFMVGLPSRANEVLIQEIIKSVMQSMFYFVIWFWYLSASKRVAATYSSYSTDTISEVLSPESESFESPTEAETE